MSPSIGPPTPPEAAPPEAPPPEWPERPPGVAYGSRGCGFVGALHLPDATRVLEEGMLSPAREVRAMESTASAAVDPKVEDEAALQETVASRR